MDDILELYKQFDKMTKNFINKLYLEEKEKEEKKNGRIPTKVQKTRNYQNH